MKTLLKTFLCLFTLLSAANPASAQSAADSQAPSNIFNNSSSLNTAGLQAVMPADSAFALNAYIEEPDSIVLFWEIQDGYYLYRKSLAINETDSLALLTPQIPAGTTIEDQFFGEVEVYYDRLLIRIPFDPASIEDSIHLELTYQGCAAERYCYPLQNRSLSLEIPH